ncbi:hypothetical protein [Chitinophaga vietnamensis]|nr:hypothetical protein [Chitinophaga vietnamensis]
MQKELTAHEEKKVYQTPELKDLGKIGEITNTTTSGHGTDGGTTPNYNS